MFNEFYYTKYSQNIVLYLLLEWEKYDNFKVVKNRTVTLIIFLFLPLILYFISPLESQAISNLTLTWAEKASMPTSRFELATAVVNGRIYAFGGRSEANVEDYNPLTDSWTIHNNMPSSGIVNGAVTIANTVYVIRNGSTSSYNPLTDTWTALANKPTAAFYPAVETINGRVYGIGGSVTDPNDPLSSFPVAVVEEYDPTTDTWSSRTSMPTARTGATAVTASGKIYVFGGLPESSTPGVEPPPLATVEAYNPLTDSWQTRANMPTLRYHAFGTVLNNKIYIIGGQSPNGIQVNIVEEYDPLTNTWDTNHMPLPVQQRILADSESVNGKLYVIGGYNGSGGSNTVFEGVFQHLPVVSEINAPIDPVPVNSAVNVSATFTDEDVTDTHSGTWDWADGAITIGVVDESNGSGTITGTHTYTSAGVYPLSLSFSDDKGGSVTKTYQYVVVYDPSIGFVTSNGGIDSPTGAFTANPTLTGRAKFGFVAKYQQGATQPIGQTQFNLKVANFDFQSTTLQWLVFNGQKAIIKGTGTVNGNGDYIFIVSGIDGDLTGGDGIDKFRIKITNQSTGNVVYDNNLGGPDTDDPATEITGGNIIIHP